MAGRWSSQDTHIYQLSSPSYMCALNNYNSKIKDEWSQITITKAIAMKKKWNIVRITKMWQKDTKWAGAVEKNGTVDLLHAANLQL